MPETLSILQLGDVHFPEAMSKTSLLDFKDKGFSPELAHRGAPSTFLEVVRSIQNDLSKGSIDAFVVVGDLTTMGSVPAYSECIAYLKAAFIDDRFASKLDYFRVLPGNHDLRRNTKMDIPLPEKFKEFQDIVIAAGFAGFPVEKIDSVDLGDGQKSSARLWLANSCVGCGEVRRMPDFLATAVSGHVGALGGTNIDADPDVRRAMYEDIDTPLVDEAAINSFITQTQDDHEKRIAILCAHHNLLPQYRPRVSVYGEMLNAGYLRRRLLDLPRPIVYLHGHVHDDPIEIIQTPDSPTGQIISIGAPLAQDGYNIIDLCFGHSGVPLAVRVNRIRLSPTGSRTARVSTIPLLTAQRALRALSPLAQRVYDALPNGKDEKFTDALAKNFHSGKISTKCKRLWTVLEELTLLQLISVDGTLETYTSTIIRRS